MKVLFICRSNKGRSQSAEAFFNKFSKKHTAVSAGITAKAEGLAGQPPGTKVAESMKTLGIDISRQRVKQLTPAMLRNADKIVLLLEKKEIEQHPLPKYFKRFRPKTIRWPIKDMRYAKSVAVDTKINKKIRERVKVLVKRMD